MIAPVVRQRVSLADYERMIEEGSLGEDDRVELIAGEIIEMSPIGPDHSEVVTILHELLQGKLGQTVRIREQNPVRIEPDSEPEPDLAIVRRRSYRQSHPTPADILLLIEVADSSRRLDRRKKLALYASAGIPETWLVDLAGEAIERHNEPRNGRCQQIVRASRGDTVSSAVLPAITIQVDEVLG